jgi:type IV pilus assembly protein PilM
MKMMWNNNVSLFIDETSLRLLVTNGQKVKKWAEVELEPGLIKDSVVVNEAEVGARIANLLKSQQVKTRKISLGISGLHSLTRPANLPQLPKSMLPEAVAREARRVLPVPLDQLYLSWSVIPGHKGRTPVYIAAIPRNTVDSIMRTLKLAGLSASRLSLKPLALTKAIPVNSAILVDLQTNEFDIAIMVNGISHPVRTVALPGEDLNWDEKLKMILNDLDRTIKFYNTNNPEKPLDKKMPIYVSGELTGRPQYQQALEANCGHPVMTVVPAFKGLEQLDPGRYMVNVAMTLKAHPAERATTFQAADLNVLPAIYQPKPISMVKVVGVPGGIAAVCLAVPLLLMMNSISANIDVMKKQLEMVNEISMQKTAERQRLKKQIGELEQQLTAAQTAENNALASYAFIQSSQEIISGDLLLSLSEVNSAIELHSIRQTANKLVVSGFAPSQEDIRMYANAILTYARQLDVSQRFTESIVSSISVGDNTVPEGALEPDLVRRIEFTLTFNRGDLN